jgi:hypothetical protein
MITIFRMASGLVEGLSAMYIRLGVLVNGRMFPFTPFWPMTKLLLGTERIDVIGLPPLT